MRKLFTFLKRNSRNREQKTEPEPGKTILRKIPIGPGQCHCLVRYSDKNGRNQIIDLGVLKVKTKKK